MNFQKFFELASSKGITEAQLAIGSSKSTRIALFHHEIDTYKITESRSMTALGIYKGKLGSGSTELVGPEAFEYLVDQIILTATYSEKVRDIGLFPGSSKYQKAKMFDKTLALTPIEKKIADLREIENAIYAFDSRITDASDVTYCESESASEILNSHGIHLKNSANYYYFLAGAVARDGEETKTFYDIFFHHDYAQFDKEKFVKGLCEKTIKKFGGKPCASKKYPTVLHRDIIGELILNFLDNVIAEKVQKNTSALKGKLNTKIASSKLTIEEKPLTKNMFFSPYDDELVPTQNKAIIKNGVLKTYLYNRETAAKDGVETTGNGSWTGTKFGTGFGNIFVKAGKKSFDEMIAPIKEGVYITEIAGLGTGMNETSGDFSCQAEGYMIEDGKLTRPLNLITLSGNLFKMLNQIVEFDNDIKTDTGGMSVANVHIKSMNIGGE